jgi:predicted RNase H-like HicB family nuclease
MREVMLFETKYGVTLTLIYSSGDQGTLAHLLEFPEIMVMGDTLDDCKDKIHLFIEVVLSGHLMEMNSLFNK